MAPKAAEEAAENVGMMGRIGQGIKGAPKGKLAAAGIGGLLAYNMLTGEDAPPPEEFEFGFTGQEAPGETTTQYGLGVGTDTLGGGDAYDQAQQNLKAFYDDLLGQSAQDTQRREQMINELYGEQSAYNQQLLGQMETENQTRQAELDQFHLDMQEDLAKLGAGGQGFSMASSEADRGRLMEQSLADAAADEKYTQQYGSSLDDLMRSSAQADQIRQQEMIQGIQTQGAEDQRSLRNEAMKAILGSDLDRAAARERIGLQADMDIKKEGLSNQIVPSPDRAKMYQSALQLMLGEGGDTNAMEPGARQLLNQFMMTGDANLLNQAVSRQHAWDLYQTQGG
jgi:hypothetical protein